MTRVNKSVLIPPKILNILKEELAANAALIESAKEGITKDHLLFIRGIATPIINMIDPLFNGGDHSIGNKWYSLEDSSDSLEVQFREMINILESLVEFGRCTVAAIGRREEPHENSIKTAYLVIEVPEDITQAIRERMPKFTAARENGISEEDFLAIKRCSVLIDVIDERYSLNFDQEIPLSVAERWYSSIFDEDGLSISEDGYEQAYEKMYAILHGIVHFQKAKIIYSTTGLRLYNENNIEDIYEKNKMEDNNE